MEVFRNVNIRGCRWSVLLRMMRMINIILYYNNVGLIGNDGIRTDILMMMLWMLVRRFVVVVVGCGGGRSELQQIV